MQTVCAFQLGAHGNFVFGKQIVHFEKSLQYRECRFLLHLSIGKNYNCVEEQSQNCPKEQ